MLGTIVEISKSEKIWERYGSVRSINFHAKIENTINNRTRDNYDHHSMVMTPSTVQM